MDEKRIEQVLEIENKAEEIQANAAREADQLPKQADQEAQNLLAKSRTDAEAEARRIVANAKAEDEVKSIIDQAQQEARNSEGQASNNLQRAVNYVLNRVIGKE